MDEATDDIDDSQQRLAQFQRIYDEELDYVWGGLGRLGVPRRDREDLAHEVFIVVYEKLHTYDRDRPIRPWLFGICFRVASDYRRKASNRREKLVDNETATRPSGMMAKISKDEARDIVNEALEEVKLERRVVFILHELDGHAIPLVAEELSIPLNTAYSRLRLAREEFEAAIKARFKDEVAQ